MSRRGVKSGPIRPWSPSPWDGWPESSGRQAIKWNSPFYGALDREGWFLSHHCFTKYVKLTFFRGSSLSPPPPVKSKYEAVRYFHIHEDDKLDEALLAGWLKQASELPGEKM